MERDGDGKALLLCGSSTLRACPGTAYTLTAYTPDADRVIPSGIGNSSRMVRWVDIAVLIKKILRPDDITRPRRRVFDDDHPLAYIGGGGLGNALLRCGWSASGIAPHRDRKPSGIGNSSAYTRWGETVTVRRTA